MRNKTYRLIIIFVITTVGILYLVYGRTENRLHQVAKIAPARLENSGDAAHPRIVLAQRAAERLAIETMDVSGQMNIPYSSIVYDVRGNTWVYISPEPLTYVREQVYVNSIFGDQVFLSKKLSAHTNVVIVGVPELFGIEHGIGQKGKGY